MIRNLLIIASVLFLNACAYHHGTISTSATSEDYNKKVIGSANGKSVEHKILGLGGFNKNTLVAEAKYKLYQNYPLEKGQAYRNFTVDFKRGFYLIYSKTTVTINADILGDSTDFDPLLRKINHNNYYYCPKMAICIDAFSEPRIVEIIGQSTTTSGTTAYQTKSVNDGNISYRTFKEDKIVLINTSATINNKYAFGSWIQINNGSNKKQVIAYKEPYYYTWSDKDKKVEAMKFK